MKRWIEEPTATTLGGLALVAGLAAVLVAAMGEMRMIPATAVWAIPLVAGGTVGLLSWFLLGGVSDEEARDAGPAKARCATCGMEVLEEWRLCPYCGGSARPFTAGDGASSPTA